MVNQSSIDLGSDVIVTLTDSQSLSNKSFSDNVSVTGSLVAGSIVSSGNIVVTGSIFGYGGNLTGVSNSGLPQGVLPYGSLTAALPQGVLPTGSIPSLSTVYIPQGAIPVGSLAVVLPQGAIPAGSLINSLPQGQVPVGSLTAVIPQGVLPVGSIPSLTAYIPQGVIPAGSLTNSLPQGVLPVGSIPSLTAYIPQGQLNTGSLPNTISVSGNGSFIGSVVAAGFYGYGGSLTGITASAAPAGSNTTLQFNDAGAGSGDIRLTWSKANAKLALTGSLDITNTDEKAIRIINSVGSVVNSLGTDGKFRFGTGNASIGSAPGLTDRMCIDGGADTIEFTNFSEIYFADGNAQFELYSGGVGSIEILNQSGNPAHLKVQNDIISNTGSFVLGNTTTGNSVDLYAADQQSPFFWLSGSTGRNTLFVNPHVNTKLNLQTHRPSTTTTISSVGMNLTSRGVVSHQTPSYFVPYGFGYTTVATVAGSTVGFFGATNLYHRGSLGSPTPMGGFAMYARAFYPDSSYGSIVTFIGMMPSASVPALLSAMQQNVAAHHIGFQYSLGSTNGRNDTNWQFVSRDAGAVQGSTDTGMPFKPGSVYDFTFYLPNAGSTAYWSITEFQRNITVSGSHGAALFLPGSGTMMTPTGLMTPVAAAARIMRFGDVAAWTTG